VRTLALLATLLLAGCPPPAPPPPIAPPAPPAPPAPVVSSAPTPDSGGPIPVTVTKPPPPAPGESGRLARGERLEAGPECRVGLVAVVEGRAQLDVGVGPFHYTVTAGPGERVAVGPGGLLVDAVELGAKPVVRPFAIVRWDGAPPDLPLAKLELQPKSEAGRLLLREQALFALPDGTRVGVGEVRERTNGTRVLLSVFPPGYDRDPGLGYARDVAFDGAVVGADAGRRLRVTAVTPRGPDRPWATVTLVHE
jgi:hypothetical protein